MGARSQAEALPARRYVEIPAWVALVIAVAALVVGIYALRTASEDTTTRGSEVAVTNPWAGVDRGMLQALREAGFTGRLGGATVGTTNPWAGIDREALEAAGFTGRLGGATVSEPTNPWAGLDREDLEALKEAGFTGRLGG